MYKLQEQQSDNENDYSTLDSDQYYDYEPNMKKQKGNQGQQITRTPERKIEQQDAFYSNNNKQLSKFEVKKSGIELHKPLKKNYEGVVLKPNEKSGPLQSQFVTLLVGKPGSGKTFLMTQFLLNAGLYLHRFDKIYILSPSILEGVPCKLKVNYNNEFDVDWINEKINNMIDIITAEKFTSKKNILFIIDDFVSQVKKEGYNKDFQRLLFNRRHFCKRQNGDDFLCISYMFTTQKYKLFPHQVRQVLTSIIFFNSSIPEYNAIKQECIFSRNPRVDDIIMRAFDQDPYNFIYIRLDNSKIHVKFDELVL